MVSYKHWGLLVLLSISIACSKDIDDSATLQAYVQNRQVVLDNVIACAASDTEGVTTQIFLYPRTGASNIRYFETNNALENKFDFSNYVEGNQSTTPVLNGYLLKFDVNFSSEKWVVVTFEEDGKISTSNPIRIKHLSKPTEYLPQNINVDSTTQMPLFMWEDGAYTDSAIYFQVVSDQENNLLSGTYTYERKFRYYDTENVVLNVTRLPPPQLDVEKNYMFTLMAVSEDNWVNQFSQISFNLGQ